jgi:ribose/xylose/arabinose/galactoside ABC-type transport system permease subunit
MPVAIPEIPGRNALALFEETEAGIKSLLRSQHAPLLATLVVLVALFTAASLLYEGFFSLRVVSNLLGDNAFLGIAAVGMTFVILSGGIDLSVGSMLAFSTILIATLVQNHQVPAPIAMLVALIIGASFGALMGFLIQRYELPPFLVTLGGMFFARGMAFVISQESIGITNKFYDAAQAFGLPLSDRVSLPLTAVIVLVVFAIGAILAHSTRFGRNVFAMGGNEASARLMGLPVNFTKVAVYALSGLCSAIAGIVATFYMGSGNPAFGVGFELDVIASVVIGGTLLTGGVGTIAGTLIGVLIFGTIQTALNFDGRLNSWWLRIAIGLLLLLFILFQRFLSRVSALSAQAEGKIEAPKTPAIIHS